MHSKQQSKTNHHLLLVAKEELMNIVAIRQRTQSIKNKNGPLRETIKITYLLIFYDDFCHAILGIVF